MFEAVGERFWPGYFAQLHKCLKPGGARRGADHHHRQ
jgi:cyclopropane fatty-acyl-phospholipid synthase-like methyltransferase